MLKKMLNGFEFSKNGTNLQTEILAGVTTFLSAMYIIIVNPLIMQSAGMPFPALLTATVLVSAFSSIFMGIYARNPIIVAPGMGINAFFTFTVVIGMKVPWPVALGAVFWSGIIFFLLSVFNIRNYIVYAIPKPLRYSTASGIGIFITFVGFRNAGFIVSNSATLISQSPININLLIFIFGLFLTIFLIVRKIKGAIVIGILLTTLIAVGAGRLWDGSILVEWKGLFQMPDFSLIGALDLKNSLHYSLIPVIFSFLFVDMFDSLSTLIGVAEAADLKDADGEPRNLKESLIVDAFATSFSGLVGTSSGSAYIESLTGIEEGGRTGLTAVVAGLLFLPFMFLSPLLSIVPGLAVAPALVLVGAFMISPVLQINWNKLEEAIPAFLAMILIPLSSSITQGIIWGFLSWTFIKIIQGKSKELPPMLYVMDICSILALYLS